MKKEYTFLNGLSAGAGLIAALVALPALLFGVGLLMVKCNPSTEYDFSQAVAQGDFENARKALTEFEVYDSARYEQALRTVNDKEIYALLAKPSRDGDARILYLYNSYEEDQLPDMQDVVDVAISMGNENLSIKLLKAGVGISYNIAVAAANADMADLVNLILKKKPEYILEEEVAEYYQEEKGTAALQEFTTKVIKSGLDRELQNLYRLTIPTRPALGLVKSEYSGKIPKEYTDYKNEVEYLNNRCKELISKSVEFGQTVTANKAFSLMKPNLEWNNIGDWVKVVEHTDHGSVYNTFKVAENRNEINEARKLLTNK